MIDYKNREGKKNLNDRRRSGESAVDRSSGREIKVTFMVDEQLIEKLKRIAESKDCLIKDEVNLALQERISSHEKEQPPEPEDVGSTNERRYRK